MKSWPISKTMKISPETGVLPHLPSLEINSDSTSNTLDIWQTYLPLEKLSEVNTELYQDFQKNRESFSCLAKSQQASLIIEAYLSDIELIFKYYPHKICLFKIVEYFTIQAKNTNTNKDLLLELYCNFLIKNGFYSLLAIFEEIKLNNLNQEIDFQRVKEFGKGINIKTKQQFYTRISRQNHTLDFFIMTLESLFFYFIDEFKVGKLVFILNIFEGILSYLNQTLASSDNEIINELVEIGQISF